MPTNHDPVPFRPPVANTQPPYDAPLYRTTAISHPTWH